MMTDLDSATGFWTTSQILVISQSIHREGNGIFDSSVTGSITFILININTYICFISQTCYQFEMMPNGV